MVMDKLSADAMDSAQSPLENGAIEESQEYTLNYRGALYNAKNNSTLARSEKAWYRWSTLGLRTKATLLAIAIGALPPLIVGSVGYQLAKESITQQAIETQASDSLSAIDTLTRFLFERYGDIQILANLAVFREGKLNTTVSLAEQQKILTKYAQTYQVYDSIAVYTPDGNLVVNGGVAKAPPNVADRVYFQEALRGKYNISQPTVSKVKNVNTVIFFAAPIRDSQTNQIIGVIRSRMPIADLEKVIAKYGNLKEGKNYHFFDSTGQIFMASEASQIGVNINEEFPDADLTGLQKANKAGVWIGYDQSQKTVETLNSFVPTAEFQGMPNLKWGLVLTNPTEQAFKASRELLWTIALGTLGVTALVSLLAVYLANRAIRPIESAAEVVEKIGQGDFEPRIEVQGEDELAVLATNINKMAAELEALLEQQKAETERIEVARQEARMEADTIAQEQREAKEFLQKRALELLLEVDPVSRGDLTVRAKVTPDEIGTVADSYNAIIRSLRQIVEQVQEAVVSVADTAQDNAATVQKVASEATEQTNAIAKALQEIQLVTQTSEGVAAFAKQAEQQVQQATAAVQDGDAAMNRTVEGISAIRETVSQTSKKVKRLGEASQKISKVVNLISGFAAQTNLLALNAAIEAARAGEEGRGFSVVAEEVRALAQQSAAATAEIEALVEEIQTQTNEVVVAMESGTEQVVEGTRLVEESRQKLTQISNVSTQVNRLIQDIADAAVKQTTASSAVSLTMQDVAEIAEDTSQQSESMANSFERLLEVAQTLQVSVAQFKV